MKLLLFSQHNVLADALGFLLEESRSDVDWVGTSDSGREGLQMARDHGVDLAIVDTRLREGTAIDVTRALNAEFEGVLVLILAADLRGFPVAQALEAGADGILGKECDAEELDRAIGIIRTGQTYLCPDATTVLVNAKVLGAPTETDPVHSLLTPREREVLQLLAEGWSSREAGERLNISSKTVDTHRRHIFKKLQADSLPDLVKHAIRAGLVDL